MHCMYLNTFSSFSFFSWEATVGWHWYLHFAIFFKERLFIFFAQITCIVGVVTLLRTRSKLWYSIYANGSFFVVLAMVEKQSDLDDSLWGPPELNKSQGRQISKSFCASPKIGKLWVSTVHKLFFGPRISFPGGLREVAVEGADAGPTFLLSRVQENAKTWKIKKICSKISKLMMIKNT